MKDFEKGLEEIINKLLLRVGYRIEAEAKRRCPVDTGRLRASITTIKDGKSVIVGSNVEYAPYVEFLYNFPQKPRTIWPTKAKRGGDGTTMPFLRPALYMANQFLKEEIKKLR